MPEQKSMVSSDRKLANAVAGKSARACDSCVRKRARWYCAADDAFLCQSCDSSVHSANPLARRHERVRLKTVSLCSSYESKGKVQISTPSWHQGFTRKARTPRQKKVNLLHLVPELCSEEQCNEENEEQLLYRVPVFDPFEVSVNAVEKDAENRHRFGQEMVLPSEMDVADFAADVESLLGKGLDDESFDMEGLGILDSQECSLKMIKFEHEDIGEEAMAEKSYQIDMGRETFELNFDYGSPITCEEEEEKKGENGEGVIFKNKCKVDDFNKTFLKLDYEGVFSAWDEEKSPWTTGERPELNSGDFIPDCLGTSGAMHVYGDMGTVSGQGAAAMADGGREARVSRYREKRRTRLFSKKIRYEVRKLNAEKRPRMKGRFVKKANFVASAFPLLNK